MLAAQATHVGVSPAETRTSALQARKSGHSDSALRGESYSDLKKHGRVRSTGKTHLLTLLYHFPF